MVNKLSILVFISLSISLSLSYHNDTSDDLQIVKLEYIGQAKVVINQTDLYIVSKASRDLVVTHSLSVPKERKTLENSIFYAISNNTDNIKTLDYRKYENLTVTTDMNNMTLYSGVIELKKGEYAITLCKDLVKGETVVIKMFYLGKNFLVYFIIIILLILFIAILICVIIYCICKYQSNQTERRPSLIEMV